MRAFIGPWAAMAGMVLAGCMAAEDGQAPSSVGAPSDTQGQPTLDAEDAALVESTAAEHADDAPSPTPLADAAPESGILEQEVAYGEAGDRNLTGYLAMPDDALEPLPGVVVIHEWWGLNDNVRAASRRLAAEGYVVLAVDLYGGAVAETPDAAQSQMTKIMSDPEAVMDNLRQGYEYLDRYAFAPGIASLGWCLGGGWSLQLALALPEELDATVMYYGQVVTDETRLAELRVPVLGLFAENDQSIPVADVQTFRSTLGRLGKEADIRIYAGVEHAFANPSGGSYDAESADDAWNRTIAFLDAHLK